MNKELGIALGTIGFLAAGSVYGLYRLVATYYDFGAASAELPAAARAYRAAGLPFVASDIAPKRPAPANDATPALRAALKALPGKEARAEMTKAARNPGPAADPVVAKYAKSLAIVETAVGRNKVDFRRDWDRGIYVLFPEYAGMKALARAATVRAVCEAQRGDDASALRDLALAQRIALWAEQEPTLISMLVRLSSEVIMIDGADRCLAAAKGDRARIARYANWLKKAPAPPDFRYALYGEAWMGVTSGRNLDIYGGMRKFSGTPSSRIDPRRLRRDGLPEGTPQRGYMARVLQVWTEAAKETDDFRKPPIELGEKMDEIGERWTSKKGISRVLVAILFPTLGQAGKAVVNLEAKRAVALGFAEALDAQARTGRWPAAVTIKDPFAGGPLKVRRGKDFRVYSIGKDAKDDGGLHRRERPKTPGATFDEVAAYPPL